MHHTMKLHPKPFSKMASGNKKSEFRLNDEKRQYVSIGDFIEFTNIINEEEKILTKVTYLNHYPTFADLFESIRQDYPDWEKDSFIQGMYQYYNPEEEMRYGVLEIGISLLSPTD